MRMKENPVMRDMQEVTIPRWKGHKLFEDLFLMVILHVADIVEEETKMN
jgi:hypothetical protein